MASNARDLLNHKNFVETGGCRDSMEALIKKAKKAHNNKDYEKSITLARKALNEANMAFEQYEKQKDNYRFLD